METWKQISDYILVHPVSFSFHRKQWEDHVGKVRADVRPSDSPPPGP